MKTIALIFVSAAAIAASIAFSGVFVSPPSPASAASSLQTAADTNVVSVSGHGVIQAIPDKATINAGVTTQGTTAKEALASNSKKMNSVLDALKRAGGKNIQTQQVYLSPQFSSQNKIHGYSASNSVSAKIDVASAGSLVDAAVSAGATNVDGPTLSLSDQDGLYRLALKKAVSDARFKAQALGEAANFSLGKVVSITESSAPQPPSIYSVSSDSAAKSLPTPVVAGNQEVTADISVSFEIK
jgi:uncharacterized protein YggE